MQFWYKCNKSVETFFWFKRKNYWFFRDSSFLLSEAKYKVKYAQNVKS